MFLSQSFTILRNILLDLDFYVYVIIIFFFFCVFNGENTKVGYGSLTERILGR